MNPNHEWRLVPGFNRYMVSEYGEVYSLISDKLITPSRDKDGYLKFKLYSNGERHYFFAGVLVLTAFERPRPDGYQCCHGDGNKLNNHRDNLNWGTAQDNAIDSIYHGVSPCIRLGDAHGATKLPDAVARMIANKTDWVRGEKRALARKYGVTDSIIGQISNGRKRRHLKS